MPNKNQDQDQPSPFKYHYQCSHCEKPVKTNHAHLAEAELCHDCAREKRMVQQVLEKKGLVKMLKHIVQNQEPRPEREVPYKCPKCGSEGKFMMVNGEPDAEDVKQLQSMPGCPMCMLKSTLEQTETHYVSPFKTEGPIGERPVIIDPDTQKPVGGDDEQSIAQ